MNKGKQATLFQSWGQKKKACESKRSVTGDDDVIDLCLDEDDDDDDLLAQALEASALYPETNLHNADFRGNSTEDHVPGTSTEMDICNISIGTENFSSTQGSTQTNVPDGFDKSAGKLWIYPTNYPVREYQFNIVQQCLYKNTMVTLPTGLGKTFIASVIMYNFYRWYPLGKIVFMAPTKPLVAQQIEACYNIMGIPQKDTAEMTGNMSPPKRRKAWHDKRVFFLTPQVLTNDLSRGTCPAELVKCLVVDEAHKALGNHAYCQVVRELSKYTRDFRILALSATPGSDIKAVQQVLANLLISHIEIRTEESADIKKYSHERKVEKIVVPLGDELTLVKTKYLQILDIVVTRLKRQRVLYNRDTKSLSKFLILKAREAFRQNPPEHMQRSQFGIVEGDFALAMSLFHGYELLQLHGLRSLYNFLDGIISGDKGQSRTRSELMKNPDFTSLMEMLQQKFSAPELRASQATQSSKKAFVTGHPKMEKLQEVVVEHFDKFIKDEGNKGRETRIMIFSQYRDSVTEITNMLKQHYPVVKVMSFIGQSSAGKATKGFTQKEQLKVMKQFRDGGYNTLVSTCVGEEGLDIGEVDLIICFDAHKSPIRLVQRMGRTGRKREGRIVMLVTQGKEEQIYNQSLYSKKSIHKAILNGARSLNFYQCNPRMVPDGWDPQCHKMFITVKETFKPAKRSTDLDDKDKISSMMENKTDNGLLTKEQYREWKENYWIPDEEVKKLNSGSEFLSLSTDQEGDTTDESESLLSLNKWLPWQNRQQPAYQMGHSEKSKHLVELVEFIELQQTLDPNEDNYGQEMELFLNEEDVIKPGEENEVGDGKITKFFKTGTEENTDTVKSNKRRIRRSDLLQDFESDKEPEESDEDLPVVCFDSNHGNAEDKNRKTSVDIQNVDEPEVVSVYVDTTDTRHLDKGETNGSAKGNTEDNIGEVDELGFKSGINRIKRKSTKKLLKNEKSMQKDRAANRVNIKEENFEKKKKNKKKRSSLGNTTVVQIIADNDGNDFSVNVNSIDPQLPDMSTVMDNFEISKNTDENLFKKEDINIAEIAANEHENSDVSDMDVDHCDQIDDGCKDNEASYSELLPCFHDSDRFVRQKSCSNSDSSSDYRIPTPPSVQEIEGVISSLGNIKTLPNIDLVQLVEEWTAESVFSKKGTKSKNKFIKSHNEKRVEMDTSEIDLDKDVMNACSTTKLSVSINNIRITSDQNGLDVCITEKDTTLNENSEKNKMKISGHEKDERTFTGVEFSKDMSEEKIVNTTDGEHPDINNGKNVDLIKSGEDRSPSESDDEDDMFLDTQANFMLAEGDNFLTDLDDNMCDNENSPNPHNNFKNVDRTNKSDESRSSHDLIDNKSEVDKFVSNKTNEVISEKTSAPKKPLFKVLPTLEDTNKMSSVLHLEGKQTCSTSNSKFKYQISPSENKNNDRVDDSDKRQTEKIDLASKLVTKNQLSGNNSDHCLVNTETPVRETIARWTNLSLNVTGKQTPQQTTNTSASLFDDSLFKDEICDNDILAAIKTPKILSSKHENKIQVESVKNQKQCLSEGLESQFTFTQALACVHSSSEGSPTDEVPNFNIKSPSQLKPYSDLENHDTGIKTSGYNQTEVEIIEKCNSKGNNSEIDDYSEHVSEDDEDELPTFDLGFNIDEDIIPPSPCASQSFSQKPLSKCLSQSTLKSRKSLSSKLISDDDNFGKADVLCDNINLNKEAMKPIAEENDSLLMYDNEDIDNVNFSKNSEDNEFKKTDSKKGNPDSSFGVELKLNISSSRRNISPHCLSLLPPELSQNQGEQDEIFNIDDDFIQGPSSPILSGRRASSQKKSPSTPALDDSFVIRKKRRVAIIDSPDTPETEDKTVDKIEQNKVFEFKTPVRPALCRNKNKKRVNEDSDDFISELGMKERKKLSVTFDKALVHKTIDDDDDDDDFEDPGLEISKIEGKKSRNLSINHNNLRKETKIRNNEKQFTTIKRKKSKSPAEMFIVGEAEVSDEDDVEISDDEADNSDLDHMEDSFIHEGTQLSQDCSEDMHAIYLKSVRSPGLQGSRGRFKLKYNHGDVDVFSQAPRGEDEEESQYIDDSFCVDDDYEETFVDIEEEVELCKDLNETSYIGRRTRWSKPVKQKAKKTFKSNKKLKRIRTLVDSSSDEESNRSMSVCNLLPPKESPAAGVPMKPRKRQILSSSDDDVVSKSANEHSPEDTLSLKSRIGKFVNPDFRSDLKTRSECQGKEQQDDKLPDHSDNEDCSQEIMLSLKSRISKTGNSAIKSFVGNHSETLSSKSNTSYTVFKSLSVNSNNYKNLQETDQVNESSYSADKIREERLRKQKEKQEEFRRKMAEKQKLIENKNSKCDVDNSEQFHKTEINVISLPTKDSDNSKSNITVNVSDLQSTTSGKLVILVDSREINGAQDIVSDLRFEHKSSVIAAQMLGCDYVVSNRMGVDRKQWAEFSNGANKNRLLERIQNMCELYDRPCLIIERDRIKGDEKGGSRPLHWTKYVDRTLVQLVKSKVVMYFTESQKETAAILADLCRLEQRKRMSISVPTDLSQHKQNQVKFYSSIPKLSYTHSLNLCYNCKSVSDFLTSSAVAIRNKGHMSEQRAVEVYNYIRRTFDTQMLPTSYG